MALRPHRLVLLRLKAPKRGEFKREARLKFWLNGPALWSERGELLQSFKLENLGAQFLLDDWSRVGRLVAGGFPSTEAVCSTRDHAA